VKDSRHRCALVIGPRVMSEREIGHSELHHLCPQPLSTFCIRTTRQGPTTISWLAPPIRARDQTGLRLGLMPLDARWGQSNMVTFKMMSSSSTVGDGGSDSDKGERVEAVGDHALHIWTERDRRKKMKSVSSSLHSLLPRLPPKVSTVILIFLIICYLVNRSFLT
jgi:hypothetical protein